MRLLDQLWGRLSPRRPAGRARGGYPAALAVELLEDRTMPSATAVLNAGTLVVTGDPNQADERLFVSLDRTTNQIVVQDNDQVVGRFSSPAVTAINVSGQARDLNIIRVFPDVAQPATLVGGPGTNFLYGGGGPTTEVAGPGTNRLAGGVNNDVLDGTAGNFNSLGGGPGLNTILAGPRTNLAFGANDRDVIPNDDPTTVHNFLSGITLGDASDFLGLTPSPNPIISAGDVKVLLDRASAATPSNDGIIAIVDRGGRVLGIRVESDVLANLGVPASADANNVLQVNANTPNVEKLVFAIDGAIAKARTGAFFASNQAPLTSRTIQFISQTTITQREVQSDPNVKDPLSSLRGPGFVAPIGLGGHFPPGVPFTPQVDLFEIEGTNRDTTINPGPDAILGTADDVVQNQRFNVDPNFIPARIPTSQDLAAPDSYGFISGLLPTAQPRGIGTLPGGLPIYVKDPNTALGVALVGGIGIFYPGKTGFADEEHSALQTNRITASAQLVPFSSTPFALDRTLEAEYAAFVAVGGSVSGGFDETGGVGNAPSLPSDLASEPAGRIDLVGITLPTIGPNGVLGLQNLEQFGKILGGPGQVSGALAPLLQPDANNQFLVPAANGQFHNIQGQRFNLTTTTVEQASNGTAVTLAGTPVPEGFLVEPHDGVGITAQQVRDIIAAGVNQARATRAAIRLPLDSLTGMVLAVSDLQGNIVGLFRMPDATIFSIDVAVAKARNVNYYANPAELQPQDQLQGVPAGTAFTNRTFRFLAEPFFPEGIDYAPPGPFSILRDPGTDNNSALNTGAPVPAAAFQSVLGFDAFNPQTNFRQPRDPNLPFSYLNQNGIVFFPGSAPLYAGGKMIGGFGVSGDGVDQDDVVTFAGVNLGIEPNNNVNFLPQGVPEADDFFVLGVRLPYQKFNRQPLEP